MNCITARRPLDTGLLMEAARRRSHELRQQAFDEFWAGLAFHAARPARSAARLARSLARHARLRQG